jgi:hypothetical protein
MTGRVDTKGKAPQHAQHTKARPQTSLRGRFPAGFLSDERDTERAADRLREQFTTVVLDS